MGYLLSSEVLQRFCRGARPKHPKGEMIFSAISPGLGDTHARGEGLLQARDQYPEGNWQHKDEFFSKIF